MRSPLIVYVDTISLGSVEAVAVAATERGIATALVCPPGSWAAEGSLVARVVETSDFGLAYLRQVLDDLDRDFEVRGIHSLFGPFRPEAFVHAVVSTLAAERGLAHTPVDALVAATNKYVARVQLAAAAVPDLPFGLATDEESLLTTTRAIGYPVVLKPLTGVGSSLIFKCCDDREALENLHRAQRELPRGYYDQLRMAAHEFRHPDGHLIRFDPICSMLVERYVDGREASVQCLVVGEEVIPLVVHDKIDVEEVPGVVFEHLQVVPPVRFNTAEVQEMQDHAVRAVRAIGLRDMLCQVELRYDDFAGPRLLEVNPRIGAGCVIDSIETFTRLDVGATRIALILGEAPSTHVPRAAGRHAIAHLFSPGSGLLEEFSGLRRVLRLPEVRSVRVSHAAGDRVGGDSEEVFLASIWMEAADEEAARSSYEQIRRLVRIRVG